MAAPTSVLTYVLCWGLCIPPTIRACVAMNTGGGGGPGKNPTPACLHLDSPVMMADGRTWKAAGDLWIGDQISDGEGGSTDVIWIPLLDREAEFDFLEFHTNNGFGSTVTPDHYVFAGECGGHNNGSIWPMKRADTLTIGECVPTADGVDEDRIVAINRAKLRGKVLPITRNGKLATGGVTVSCYCSEYTRSSESGKYSLVDCVRRFYDLGEHIYEMSPDEKYGDSIVIRVIDVFVLGKFYQRI